MSHIFLHPLHMLWRERIEFFWPIWIAITLFGLVLVVWWVPRGEENAVDSTNVKRVGLSRPTIFPLLLLSVFLACYIAGSLFWEDFTYYDNNMFTLITLAGHNIAPPIWPDLGRFFPLGYQEFNVLRHFTHSIFGYHSLHLVQLLVMVGMLLTLDAQLSIASRVALVIISLLTPSVLISYSALIYPDWNLLFWFVCLIWALKHFDRKSSLIWAAAAVVSAQFLLYYKETAFLLLFGFVAARVILRCWNAERRAFDISPLRQRNSILDICLAGLVVPFLLFYLAAMFPKFRTDYASNHHLPLPEVLGSYLALDLLVWVLVALVLARVTRIFLGKTTPWPLWDSLAIGGVAYFAGYLILGMFSAYYLIPADVIAVLYVGRSLILSFSNMPYGVKVLVTVSVLVILVQALSLSAFRMYEAKNVMHTEADMANTMEDRYRHTNGGQDLKLFFPFARPYRIMNFAGYLSLQIPVDGVPSSSPSAHPLRLAGRSITMNGPCVPERSPICEAASTPDAGDLVVVLPDDKAPPEELAEYQQHTNGLLLSYHSVPAVPRWLSFYVHHLHIASPSFAREELPTSWLNASIAVWK